MGQKKSVRLSDIARELDISAVSVSNALNGKRGVGRELREKVKEKARELGYQPPEMSAKRELHSYSIGVIIAERYIKEFPSFYMDVYKQIAQVAAKKGSITLLEIVDPGKEKLEYPPRLFTNMTVNGILFVGEMNINFIKTVRKNLNVPAVGIDFYSLEEKMDYIVTDSLHGMQKVTQILIDAGHKDILFLGNPYATISIMDRYMGYCMAMKRNLLSERYERFLPDRGEKLEDASIDFELPEKIPTAFAVNCDKSAYKLMEKLAEKNLRIPEDVSIVSFDRLHVNTAGSVELTTYDSDEKALAQTGLQALIRRMEGRHAQDEGTESIQIVGGKVIEGNSIKKISPGGGKKRMVKLKDIAAEIGVSVVTVSNALSGKGGVSSSVRKEIIQKAKELGYDTERYGKKCEEEFRVGVLVSRRYLTVGSSFYWAMYQQVAYMASKRNSFTMLAIIEDQNPEKIVFPSIISDGSIDGVLVIGYIGQRQIRYLLSIAKVPVVLLDFCDEDLPCDAVMSNNYLGMYKAVRYLQDKGHENIAFVGSIQATDNIMERFFGYRKALEERGKKIRKEWVLEDRDIASGRIHIELPENMPSAFACNSDHTAGFLYDRLIREKYQIPEHISIVSYDNYLFGHPFESELTTYNVDMRLMAKIALELLTKRKKNPDKPREIRYVDSVIIERNSVKPLTYRRDSYPW